MSEEPNVRRAECKVVGSELVKKLKELFEEKV